MVPQLLTTVAAWPLAAYLRDFRVLLYLLVGKGCSAPSFACSRGRAFRLRRRPDYLKQICSYTLPLLVSSLMMVAILQGDRLLIAGAYTLSQLGEYAVAAMLVTAPNSLR